MTRSVLLPLASRRRRMRPQQVTHSLPHQRRSSNGTARPPSSAHSSRELVQVLQTHNHHVTVVSTSRISPAPSISITPSHSLRSTIPTAAPCCFDQCSSMTPKPAAHRAHRANSVYSTPSSGRPSRHPSSMHHRFGKFSPASRRAFHALFSRRLRTRPQDPNQPSFSTDPASRITEERLKVLTDENARLRARVVELMSRILCGSTEEGLAVATLNGEGVRNSADIFRGGTASDSRLNGSVLPPSVSAPPLARISVTDSVDALTPPSRTPSDGVTPAAPILTSEAQLRDEAEALRESLDHAAKENERLKKCLTDLQEESQRQVRSIEEEKEELEGKLSAAREDREVMENELCELREWSTRNIARKDVIVEAVKKEAADTREEVNMLNEMIQNLRRDNANQGDVGHSDSAEPQVSTEGVVETTDTLEENIISLDRSEDTTDIIGGVVTEIDTDSETPAGEEVTLSDTRGGLPISASVLPIEEEENTTLGQSEGHGDVAEVQSIPETDVVVVREEPVPEEGKDEDEDDKISPATKQIQSHEGVEKVEKVSRGVDTVSKKIQSVHLESDNEEMKDLKEKRFQESELANPLMMVEREQIIVGHFCGHVVHTVNQLLGRGNEVRTKEEQLKQLIAEQWEKWVGGSISKVELIETLVEWVRGCCDKGAEMDVVQSFNAWFVGQYTQYKSRSSSDHANGAEGGGKIRRVLSKVEEKSSGNNSEGGSNVGEDSVARRVAGEVAGPAGDDKSLARVGGSRSSREITRQRGSGDDVQEEGEGEAVAGSEAKPEEMTEGDVDEVMDATTDNASSAAMLVVNVVSKD